MAIKLESSFAGVGPLPGANGAEGSRPERPYFDDVSPRNVSAVVGQAAVLRCRAKHIGNRTVSSYHRVDFYLTTKILTGVKFLHQ